ncbi:hypothetical protein GALL_361030 [mine drainage metagenome]|uniref:Polysaccharide biosynthesis protein n=1 Tax=mine drainage metagenome TaxID=410659 RepID=A0A1J5QQD1_9ZZZZ
MLRIALLLGAGGMLAAPLLVRLLFGWGRMDASAQALIVQSMRWLLALLPLQAAQLVLAARLNSHRRIADQVLAYGSGLLGMFALAWWLPDQWWRAPAAYAAAYAVATPLLWQRVAQHSADAEPANLALLGGGVAILVLFAALLGRLPAAPLGGAALAAALVAAGALWMLRHDALAALVGARLARR